MRAIFALEAGVEISSVDLAVSAGSVVITVSILAPSDAAAVLVANNLNSGVLANAAALTAALNTTLVNMTVATINSVPTVEDLNPDIIPTDSLALVNASTDMSTGSLVAIALVVSLLILAAFGTYKFIRRRRAQAEKVQDVPPNARPGARELEIALRGEFGKFEEDVALQKDLIERIAKLTSRYDALGNHIAGIDPKRLKIVKMREGSIVVTLRIAEPSEVAKSQVAQAKDKLAGSFSRKKGGMVSPTTTYEAMTAHDFQTKLLTMTPAALGYFIGYRVLTRKDITLRNPNGSPSTLQDRTMRAVKAAMVVFARMVASWVVRVVRFSSECMRFYWVFARTCSLAKAKEGAPPPPSPPPPKPKVKVKIAPKQLSEEEEERRKQLDSKSIWTSGKGWLKQKSDSAQTHVDSMRFLQASSKDMGALALKRRIAKEEAEEKRRVERAASVKRMARAKHLMQKEAARIEWEKPLPPPPMTPEEMIEVAAMKFDRERDPARLASLEWSFNADCTVNISFAPTGSYEAATVVQTALRGKEAKKEKKKRKAKKDKDVQDALEEDAATVMQSAARGKKAKKKKKEKAQEKQDEMEEEAAVVVQAAARGAKAKKKKKQKEQEKQEEVEEEAAVVVQSAARVAKAKKKKKQKEQEAQDELEGEAATVVQTAIRGKKAKKKKQEMIEEKVEQEAAATVVQSAMRGKKAKKKVQEMAEEKEEQEAAATVVQSAMRGKKAKKVKAEKQQEKEEQDEAATIVQSAIRSKKAKKVKEEKVQAKQEEEAAVIVQSGVRMKKSKSEAKMLADEKKLPKADQQERAEAATTVQAKVREGKAKEKVKEKKAAKEHMEQEKLLPAEEQEERAEAATKVQSKARASQAKAEVGAKKQQKEKADKDANDPTLQAKKKAKAEAKAKMEAKTKAVEKQLEEKKENEAATKVQNSIRKAEAVKEKNKRAEEKARIAKEKEDKEQAAAATKLQNAKRMADAKQEKAKRVEAKQDKEQAAAATKLQNAKRVADAKQEKAKRAQAKQDKEEAAAATKLQSMKRGQQERKQVADKKAKIAADQKRKEDEAATKLQNRKRVSNAKQDLSTRKAAAKTKKDEEERKAATCLQARQRSGVAKKQVAMLKMERDLPEDEKQERAAAATRLASARRAQQAKGERAARQRLLDKRKQDEHDAAQAMQALMRVRNARKQRLRMQEAADLAKALGISKWAALWRIREAEAEELTSRGIDPDEPREEEQADGMWGRLTTGPLPELPPPAPDDEADLEAELEEGALEVTLGEEEETEFNDLLAELEEQSAAREAERLAEEARLEAERVELAKKQAAAKARRHWAKLRKGWPKALRVEYKAMGIDPDEEPSAKLAKAIKARLAQLARFRTEHPNYPYGPLPQAKEPTPRSNVSPRRRLPSAKVRAPEGPLTAGLPPSRPATASTEQQIVPVYVGRSSSRPPTAAAERPASGAAMSASRSDASLPVTRPSTAGPVGPMLRSSVSSIKLEEPIETSMQYGSISMAPLSRPRVPSAKPFMGVGPSAAPPASRSPRLSPSLDDEWPPAQPQLPFDGRPDSVVSIVPAARGAPREPLAPDKFLMVQQFNLESPSYPDLEPLRASPSLPSLGPSRGSSAHMRRNRASREYDAWAGGAGGWANSSGLAERREVIPRGRSASRGRPPTQFESLPPDQFIAPPRGPSAGHERRPLDLDMLLDPDRPLASSQTLRPSATTANLLQRPTTASATQQALRPSSSQVELRDLRSMGHNEPADGQMRFERFEPPHAPQQAFQVHVPVPRPVSALPAGVPATVRRPTTAAAFGPRHAVSGSQQNGTPAVGYGDETFFVAQPGSTARTRRPSPGSAPRTPGNVGQQQDQPRQPGKARPATPTYVVNMWG